MPDHLVLRLVYAANIIVAGSVGISTLFSPGRAERAVFEGTAIGDASMAVTGAFWCAIALLSACGLVCPERWVVVLVVQLIYKALWLLAFALPAWRAGGAVPGGIAAFFAVWVALLPFVIPWRSLFGE